MSKKFIAHSCLCVNRQSLILYSPELADLSTLSLPTEVVQDLEIISQPSLERILKNWVKQTQLVPKTLAIYFVEETYFFQDSQQTNISNEDPEVQGFLATIPFSKISTKIFPIQGGSRIVAINQDLLQPIVTACEQAGFTVMVAAPSFAAGITSENPFTQELAKQSLKDQSILESYNFIDEAELERKMQDEQSFLSVQINGRLIGMIIFLLAMIGLLVYLLMTQNG